MKKIMTIFVAAALGATLISCGQTGDPADASAGTAAQASAADAQPDDQAASAEARSTDQTASSDAQPDSQTASADARSTDQTASSDAQPDGNTDSSSESTSEASTGSGTEQTSAPEKSDIEIRETIENTEDGAHAITADAETVSYSNTAVNKTGEANGDEADFYGSNSAIFAANGGTLDLSEMVITTNGTHANAVFSYGEGTTVNISDSVIETSGNCSGGLMTTGGGTMNAENLNIHTTGNSSAAIRSDRGGGTVTINGGSYTTDGTGSPAIYSTADITVNDAVLTSTASQGIVIEGKNSVTLRNVTVNADNNTKNSDKSDYYQAVMIYQSMSGDASMGKAEFTMEDGLLTNANGDVFFVNNTAADIRLSRAAIINEGDGVFLRAAAAGWGNEGSNGGKVNLYADSQAIRGDILADDISVLNLYLDSGSVYDGAINPDGESGEVYVEASGGSVWSLSADSYITSLTCDADSIQLNGFKLYVNGEEYQEGTSVTGEAIEIKTESSGSAPGSSSDDSGRPSAPPDGSHAPGSSSDDSGRPSAPPDGSHAPGSSSDDSGRPAAPPDGSHAPGSSSNDSGDPAAPPDGSQSSENSSGESSVL